MLPASPAAEFMGRLQRAVHALHVTLRNSWSVSELAKVTVLIAEIFGLFPYFQSH
jgi:hypothetical protein